MNKARLPVLNGRVAESSIRTDGTHKKPEPADVRGRFTYAKRAVYILLIAIWAALPWIRINGAPAVFLDIGRRSFFLFGTTLNAQDLWLLFFLLTGVGFGLVYATALLGRVWCGWACPQTVFLDALFRPIERIVNGPREQRIRRANGPWDVARTWRFAVTHAAYAIAAVLVAHVFIAYFVSVPELVAMVRAKPSAHPEVFAWMVVVSGVFYFNYAFFREQMCVVLCPYGRLQSVLLDDDSLVVGYDEKRGEPRGKKGKTTGDCVDCNRCVVVCPTGIDIRNGLQMDCIACTACIDACDDVMDKLGRKRGLVRYDSPRGLRGEKRRVVRPRLVLYSVLLVTGATVAFFATRARTSFEANLVRLPGAPFTRENDVVRNAFEIHLVNKAPSAESFVIEPIGAPGETFLVPMTRVEIEPLGMRRVPVFVTSGGGAGKKPAVRIRIRRERDDDKKAHVVEGVFLGSVS
jgi:cytochrome c oxidase accessory protein FixG